MTNFPTSKGKERLEKLIGIILLDYSGKKNSHLYQTIEIYVSPIYCHLKGNLIVPVLVVNRDQY